MILSYQKATKELCELVDKYDPGFGFEASEKLQVFAISRQIHSQNEKKVKEGFWSLFPFLIKEFSLSISAGLSKNEIEEFWQILNNLPKQEVLRELSKWESSDNQLLRLIAGQLKKASAN